MNHISSRNFLAFKLKALTVVSLGDSWTIILGQHFSTSFNRLNSPIQHYSDELKPFNYLEFQIQTLSHSKLKNSSDHSFRETRPFIFVKLTKLFLFKKY